MRPEAQALFAKARELAAKDLAQRPDAAISIADSFRAFFSPSPPSQLRCLLRHRRAGRAGGGVQQERERVTLLAGERRCRIDHFPDPGIQAAVRFACGTSVVIALVVLGPGGRGSAGACGPRAGAGPACHSGSGFPLRC